MSGELSRRGFVAAVGVAAAGGATFGGVGSGRRAAGREARPGGSMVRVKKALKVGMIQGGQTLAEKFAIAKQAGFEGVELDSPGPYGAEEVRKAKAETGIEVPGVVDSVHWQKTLSDPDEQVRAEGRAGLEHALRDCHAFGGTSVLLVPAVVNKSVGYDEAYERSQAEIRRVLSLAEELGVRIALENVWNNFLLSPLEAARYVDEFGSDMIGWHFDIGNIVNYGWPEQWIRILGRRILKLDVKGFSRKKRDDEGLWKGFNVEIGDGDCGWQDVRRALDEIGYRGWAAAEVGGGDLARLTDVCARVERVLNA